MKTQFLSFSAALDRLPVKPQDRSCVINVAIATALAAAAPLPTSAVENPQLFFSQTVEQDLLRQLDGFNESLVLDVNATIEAMRAIWLVRYNAAHPFTLPTYAAGGCSFFESLFGVQTYLSPLDCEVYNRNAAAILHLAGVASGIVQSLKSNG